MDPGAGPQVSTCDTSAGEPVTAPQQRQVVADRTERHPVQGAHRSGADSPSACATSPLSAARSDASRPGSTSRAWRQVGEGQLRLAAGVQHGHLDRPDLLRRRPARPAAPRPGARPGRTASCSRPSSRPSGSAADLRRGSTPAASRTARRTRPRSACRTGSPWEPEASMSTASNPPVGQHGGRGRCSGPGAPSRSPTASARRPRQVADGGHLEQVTAARQQRHVHRLRDGAAPDKRDLQSPLLQRGLIGQPRHGPGPSQSAAPSASRGWRA